MKPRGAVLCALGFAGCSSATPSPPELWPSAQRSAIVAAEASPPGTPDDAVVLLRAHEGTRDSMCSAALVAPTLLLTASHCVSYIVDGSFGCTVRGELRTDEAGGGALGLQLPPSSLEVYGVQTPRERVLARGVRIFSTLSPSVCANDIALVLLDQPLDLPVLPMRSGRPARKGEAVTLIGYGAADNPSLAQPLDWRTQPRGRRSNLQIAAVGPDSIQQLVTTVAPRTVVVDGPSACFGDSGGPLLATATGAVLAVYSILDGQRCSDPDTRNLFVHVPPFASLFDQAFAAAGATPVRERDDDASDAALDAPHDDDGSDRALDAPHAAEASDTPTSPTAPPDDANTFAPPEVAAPAADGCQLRKLPAHNPSSPCELGSIIALALALTCARGRTQSFAKGCHIGKARRAAIGA